MKAEANIVDANSSWVVSNDGTCTFPRTMLVNLASMSWRRFLIDTRHLGFKTSDKHAFLLGLKAKQYEAENRFAYEMISCLASELAS